MAGSMNNAQRMNLGSLSSRDPPTLQSLQLLQNQQMIPSNYSNQLGAAQPIQLKQGQSENKIKSYSRKLAKLVSSGTAGGGSTSNSRTPNAKKKVKSSVLGSTLTQSIGNPQSLAQMIRSGQNTSRVGAGHNVSNLAATSVIYGGSNQQALASARSTLQIQTSQNKGVSNNTFDMDEHIKNVIKSVERRNRQYPNQNASNMQASAISGYLQANVTQLNQQASMINVGGGSKTARNQLRTGGLNEYSPEAAASLSKSPTNRNQSYQNQLFSQAATTTHKNTIFSNFSNSTYYMGQRKHSQQSHSLGKKSSYQGLGGAIMIPSKSNVSGSQSRKRGSTKRESQVMAKTSMSGRQQESDIISATQRSIRNYDDNTIKRKRDSQGGHTQSIPSHNAYIYAKKEGSKTSRTNTSAYRQHNQSQSQLNQSAAKKQQNWFSPPSSSHIHQANMSGANVLSTIDNNSSSALIDKTTRTSQFVSPRSFLNKSGTTNQQLIQNLIMSGQYNRHSMGETNPQMMTSYEADENYNFHNIQQHHHQNVNVDYQKVQKLSQLRFFRNFYLRKVFKQWRVKSQQVGFQKKRLMLADNLLQSQSKSFGEQHRFIMQHLNQIKYMQSIDEKQPLTESEKDQEKRKSIKSAIFNDSINGIKNCLEKLQNYIVKSNADYERRIKESSSVGRKSLDGNTSRQTTRKMDQDNQKIILQRCQNYDRFLNFALMALSSTLSYMLINSKSFSGQKIRALVKFQIYGFNNASEGKSSQLLSSLYSTHSEYYLSMNPNFKTLNDLVRQGIEETEQLIFNNRKLIEAVTKLMHLFFNKSQQTASPRGTAAYKWDINAFYQKIDFIVKQCQSNISKEQVLDQLSRDIEEAEGIIRRMEDLKQILQFEERWHNLQNNQGTNDVNFIADIESNRETWNLMEKFESLISQIPHQPVNLKYIQLDFKPLFDQLSKIPKKVISHIERKVASSLETDTVALKQDLSKAYEILQQVPSTFNVYVEQVNTVRVLKETMGELSSRHDSIKKLSLLCKMDNKINVKESVQVNIKELENYIENLPILIRQSNERLESTKPQMEQQMRQSCQSLTNKIKAFERKYIEHYIEDGSKLVETEQTLNELRYRQKMIEDLKQKVELYQECISIMNMKEAFQRYTEISCFQDYKQLERLHQYTYKLWTILDEWRQQKSSLLQKPFLKINFNEIANFVDESSSFFEQKSNEDQLFKDKLQNLSNLILTEMAELKTVIYLLKDLKHECLKKKHWNLIFHELGIQSLIQKDDFTLQDLQKVKIYSYNSSIRDIMTIAEKEHDCETQLLFIKTQLDEILKFKLVLYKDDLYIISEFDIIQQQLEEFQIQLKKISKAATTNDVELRDSINATLAIIDSIIIVLDKITDAQKTVLTLDAIFSQNRIQLSLPDDSKKFQEIKKSFKVNVTGKMIQNPSLKAFQQIHLHTQDALDKIIAKGTLIQKSLEDFIEAKRLAFPRFFFMTDKQFLEFIELAEQNLDFNKFINLLFPGVSKVFLDQPLLEDAPGAFKVPPPMVNDLSQVKSEMIELANTYHKRGLPNQKELRMQKGLVDWNHTSIGLELEQEVKKNVRQQQAPKPKEVLGLISQMNELFLFEKKVPYQQNKVECWLQAAETSMQDTVGKLINYAVNTFPKQSLDEWILDYPQQVILTTIHLILTHEINELFEEMRKEKDGEGGHGHGQGSDNGGDSEDDYTGTTPKTPDTRDLIKNSQISHRTMSQHISQKSSIRFLKKKDEGNIMANNGTAPRKVSTHEFNSKNANQTSSAYSSNHQRIKNQQSQNRHNQQYFSDEGMMHPSELGYPHMDDDEFSESELEALDLSRERKKFASNMFGSDFDLNLVADNKDDTMRILQEKSFRGLYLRLQFWINQICKSLYMSKASSQQWKQAFERDQPNAPEAPKLNMDLHPVQRLVMQTIINFLSYMRDVVYELKSKKIDNVEDFEWQKQMRLTWNGKDSGCKVDCGAWTTQQANEYLGAKQRIPLTPLTNKYFVFISAAFREKSAVLFRCVPSHDYCGDVYQEFSNICSVPFKEYQCNPKLSMKSLMQFLNGAALASVWIFFEHVDKLDYLHLQTFNKEIQMVQQQFIIAELSQDSSVITAHITVGNQSISQCQRSIERIREQASLESKKNDHDSRKGAINVGGADIKIEDNIEIQNFDGSPSNFDDDDDDDLDPHFNIPPNQLRHSNRQQSHFEPHKSGKVLQNLSQLDLEEDYQHDQQQLEEDQDDLKLDDQNNHNNTLGGANPSKLQNKVCFGVFASISHTFNLRKEKWATEVSTALQSAFRVLSLTKPEMPVITSMFLKSEGFKEYKDLAVKINDCFFRIQDMLQLNDRDDSFTISVRELKRYSKAVNCILESCQVKECLQQIASMEKAAKKCHTMTYNMERKSKQTILREIEEEDTREAEARIIRRKLEERVTSYVLYLFLYEKLYSYYSNLKMNEDRLKKDIKDTISKVFGKELAKDVETFVVPTLEKKVSVDSQIMSAAKQRGFHMTQEDQKKVQLVHMNMQKSRPVGIVGKAYSGKSELIKLVASSMLQKNLVYFNAQVMGTYREIYGIYDPFSTTQQVMEQQIGPIKFSLFQSFKNEIQKPNTVLVMDGEIDSVFNETIMPYLEYQAFNEQSLTGGEVNDCMLVALPNGIQETLMKNIPIVYEMRSLEKASPRFVSAIQIINMKDSIDLKAFSVKMKTRLVKLIQKQFSTQSSVKDHIEYCVDQLILPAINELKKARYFEKQGYEVVSALRWTLKTFEAMIKELKSLGNAEQTLIKVSLMTIIQAVGYSLKSDGKHALEEIFGGLKSKIGVRGSLFNYVLDYDSLEIKELKSIGIENDIIVNNELLRATHYSRLLLKHNKSMQIIGNGGSQKSTMVRYLLKNHQQEIAGKNLRIPITSFITHKSLRHLVAHKPQNHQQKSTLIIIEDMNIEEQGFHMNVMEFLRYTKINKFSVYTTESKDVQQLSTKFNVLITHQHQVAQAKSQVNLFQTDTTSAEFEDFFKVYIQRKLQIQPQSQQAVANIIHSGFTFLRDHKQLTNLNLSSSFNLHSLSNLVTRINSSTFKDSHIVDTLMIEYQRVVCDKFLFPDNRQVVIEQLLRAVKQELTCALNKPEEVDSMVQVSYKGRVINQVGELKEVFGDYSNSILKTLSELQTNLRKPNYHTFFLSMPGSLIIEGLQALATQLKFTFEQPQASKYRDAYTFIDSLHSIILTSVKLQKKHLIVLQDSQLNDLSYIDYVLHLITSLREATQHNSMSLFNTLDTLTNSGLRQALIEVARDLHNQQISHSPHSGISSPASPSSLTSSITDAQLLMNALTRVANNVHFVVNVQNLQNYQMYTQVFGQLNNAFNLMVIHQEATRENKDSEVLDDMQKWVHEFSVKQNFENSYDQLMKRNEHCFNNQVNNFYIPEYKSTQPLKDALFDTSSYEQINADLNLSIPAEFTLSEHRFLLFKELYSTIKQLLFKNLASHKQHYQQYYEHYCQLQADYMKKILTKDVPQVTKQHLAAFNMLSVQEKIDQCQNQLKVKDGVVKQKEREQGQLQQSLLKLSEEVQSQKHSGDSKVLAMINKLKQVTGSDYKHLGQALIQGQLSDSDLEVLSTLQALLQSKKSINVYLSTPSDLISRLQQVVTSGVPELLVNKYVKGLQKKVSVGDLEKGITVQLYNIMSEISKKCGTERKLGQYDAKIQQLKDQISFNACMIQLYQQQMSDIKEEVEDLLIKEKNMKQEMKEVLRKLPLDSKELKHMRNEHKLKSLLKQGKKSEAKLDKIKIRIKNLDGDALILACSVAYLGAFSLSERMDIRKQVSEKLLQQRNIESSEYWQNTASEQIHHKYFKKLVQNDFGLKNKLFAKMSHLFIDSLFSEFIFTFLLSPTMPVVYDSVGNYQQYLTEEILDEFQSFKVRMLFSSDYMIQEKLETAMANKKQHQLVFVNDINDYSKMIQGKSQDQPILHQLCDSKYHQKADNLLHENPQIALPLISVFSANQHFNLNHDFLAKATIFNASFVNKNEAWIEIKQILLKHFLPDNYQKIAMIKQQSQALRFKIIEKQKAFDQLFLKIKSQSVEEKDHRQLEEVRQSYIDIKQLDEDYQQYNQAFHNLINEHPLLASYSNIFVILYFALKELSRFTEEITYSWKIYTKVIDMIIAKIIRDLTMNLKNKENEESDGDEDQDELPEGRKKKKKDKEFTIDEEFFHSVIMPSIYSTIVAGIKQEHVQLFNLIFSLEIALKKTTVTQEEKDFFVTKFFKIKNCYDWRLNPHKPSTIPTGFAEPHQKIKQQEYMIIKRDVLKIYPDLRKLFETIEIKIGKDFTYKEANSLLYQKLFKSGGDSQPWKDLPLIRKINVGFICPDDEWRSKICQFVYEELTTIFDFTEDLNKLHNFIKTASWSLPIALFTSNSINIVNTVCSIASYYGVGLEVLRTDYQQSIKKHERYYQNKEVNDNLKSADQVYDIEKPLSNEAACVHYDQIDPSKEDRVLLQKHHMQRMFSKDELEIDDKQITQNQSSIQLIEKCAENGTWVLISTLKFPSFWYKISRKLEKMSKKGKVLNTFRLFFDLQGYSLQEIPESFLFNHSVKFYLTEKNNEDMEGFNDVWANILNDDLLNAKDLHNVPVLEPPSGLHHNNLNMESNLYESSMESLVPVMHSSNARDQLNPVKKTVKDDKITYSMSQSRDTIMLPQIFTQEHMRDIMMGGNDLKSPKESYKSSQRQGGSTKFGKGQRGNIEDDISEISLGQHIMTSGMLSNSQSLLMEDMSRMEGAFLSELNQAFARKMSSNQREEEKEQQPKYEMVKKPAPNHKRQQPPQKQ